MSLFDPCFNWTIGWEGKTLEQVQGDTGGMTFWGISRNANPMWAGWTLVDKHIQVAGNLKLAAPFCNQDSTLQNLVYQFYKNLFLEHNLDKIGYQELALQLFDKIVNMGGSPIRAFQGLINVTQDEEIGPVTLLAANSVVDQSGLVDKFLGWCVQHYQDIVVENPGDAKFLKGWENRCVRSDGPTA